MPENKFSSKALRDATNLLCEYAAAHLPEGYEIQIAIRKDEAELQLFDDSGDEIVVYPDGDPCISAAAGAAVDNENKDD